LSILRRVYVFNTFVKSFEKFGFYTYFWATERVFLVFEIQSDFLRDYVVSFKNKLFTLP